MAKIRDPFELEEVEVVGGPRVFPRRGDKPKQTEFSNNAVSKPTHVSCPNCGHPKFLDKPAWRVNCKCCGKSFEVAEFGYLPEAIQHKEAMERYRQRIARKKAAEAEEMAAIEAALLRPSVRYIKDFVAANAVLFREYREERRWR